MHAYALFTIACPFMCPVCSLCACLQPDKTPIHLGRVLQRGDHCTTYVYSFDDLFDCNEVRGRIQAHTHTHTFIHTVLRFHVCIYMYVCVCMCLPRL